MANGAREEQWLWWWGGDFTEPQNVLELSWARRFEGWTTPRRCSEGWTELSVPPGKGKDPGTPESPSSARRGSKSCRETRDKGLEYRGHGERLPPGEGEMEVEFWGEIPAREGLG